MALYCCCCCCSLCSSRVDVLLLLLLVNSLCLSWAATHTPSSLISSLCFTRPPPPDFGGIGKGDDSQWRKAKGGVNAQGSRLDLPPWDKSHGRAIRIVSLHKHTHSVKPHTPITKKRSKIFKWCPTQTWENNLDWNSSPLQIIIPPRIIIPPQMIILFLPRW